MQLLKQIVIDGYEVFHNQKPLNQYTSLAALQRNLETERKRQDSIPLFRSWCPAYIRNLFANYQPCVLLKESSYPQI